MDDSGLLKGKTNYPWLLAVTYMACRQEGAGRSIKEILAAQPTVKVGLLGHSGRVRGMSEAVIHRQQLSIG